MADLKDRVIAERIQFLMKGFGWDYAELGRRCGYPTGRLVGKYASGASEPGSGQLAKFADAFQVTTDFLLGRRKLGTFTEVIGRETLELYLAKYEVSHEQAYYLRRLAGEEGAPATVEAWQTTHKMISKTFDIEQELRRGGSVIPFKQ